MTLTRSQGGPEPSPDGLYERLAGFAGRAAATSGVGKDPVNLPMIRHWCEAMGDGHPAYRGHDAVAPPTMLQAWTMGGLSGHTDRSSAHEELFALLDAAGYTSVVATDCEQEYLRPLRPGDEITFDTVIESVSELKTTKLGSGHFVTTRTDVRAGGQPAGTHRFRILKYAPAARPRRPEPPAGTQAKQPEGRRPEGRQPEGGRTGGRQSAGRQPEGKQFEGRQHEGKRSEATRPRARRPRPVVNRDNAGFWEGVAAHRLLIQRCGDCAALRFPWLPGCADCGSPEWDTVEASGAGTVYSYVVMHHPSFPAFDPPYAVGLVELAEGVRMISNVVGVPYDKVRIGMPVRLEFLRVDEELELPVFRAGGED
ncbi:bifunctional MaoC family dehydratase N-terminal/OB-fold nucleic acid binding domain-containing protein [Streptomyces aureus]|uniref:bifunctional MaoC family dehydratase N-terminal/OB-fold nucleic acid binding domain-containing protein n=1 Tax=Streptomyces aureus TaxID=193461 RepID=UPI0006E2A1F3|nr:bifunctional MaoC family dehydratase N-terminal/OB-fold nucleic acid binding domain-containing protein [Streptomyces aureus]